MFCLLATFAEPKILLFCLLQIEKESKVQDFKLTSRHARLKLRICKGPAWMFGGCVQHNREKRRSYQMRRAVVPRRFQELEDVIGMCNYQFRFDAILSQKCSGSCSVVKST